jgi:hypothetical protein
MRQLSQRNWVNCHNGMEKQQSLETEVPLSYINKLHKYTIVMSRNKKTSESLFQFMNLLIALLLKNGQYRTSLHYKATLNSFKRYRDNKDIALKEIDAEVMRSYEAYLHHTVEVCRNTSSKLSEVVGDTRFRIVI